MTLERTDEARAGSRPALGTHGPGDAVERPDLSVIIVVTEHPQPLVRLYRQFQSVFERMGETYEFIFVGEPWAREALAGVRALARAGEPIRVFEVGERIGESHMLLAGKDHCRGDLLVTLPSYQRIEPDAIRTLIERVRAGAALASAARTQDHDHWVNRLSHWGFHFLLRRLVGTGLRDIASGVRVLRPEVLDEVPLYGDGFRFLPLLAAREAFQVEEVEVAQHPYDRRAKIYAPGTYFRRLFDLIGLAFLSRFTHKPLRFFGLIGGALLAVGGGGLFILTVQRLTGTPLANRPALVAAVLLVVLGVQSIALGLIGEIIVHFSVGRRPGYRLARAPDPGATSGVASSEGREASPSQPAASPPPGLQPSSRTND